MKKFKEDKNWQARRITDPLSCTDLRSDATDLQKNRSTGQQGFTLLEVMIALAIVATVLIALIGLQGRTIRLADRQQTITEATLLAQERMTEIEIAAARGESLREGTGSFDDPFTDYRWQVRFEPTPLTSVRMVTVDVGRGEQTDVTLTSFLFPREL